MNRSRFLSLSTMFTILGFSIVLSCQALLANDTKPTACLQHISCLTQSTSSSDQDSHAFEFWPAPNVDRLLPLLLVVHLVIGIGIVLPALRKRQSFILFGRYRV